MKLTFRERLARFAGSVQRFMYGRYGSDSLNRALLISALVFLVIGGVFRRFVLVYLICGVIEWLLLGWSVFRTLSKNYAKRRAEEVRYREIAKPVGAFFKLQKNRFRDRRTHVYVRCRACHAVMRLPRKKGKHTVVCPGCRQRREVRVFFDKK